MENYNIAVNLLVLCKCQHSSNHMHAVRGVHI